MTEVFTEIPDYGGYIYFEAYEHAGDHDMCIRCSALVNVLVVRCDRMNYNVDVYEPGHVRIEIQDADRQTLDTARSILDTFREYAEEFPEHVKVH